MALVQRAFRGNTGGCGAVLVGERRNFDRERCGAHRQLFWPIQPAAAREFETPATKYRGTPFF